MKTEFIVSSNEKGQRIDIWLSKKISPPSRKEAKRLLNNGAVYVNGKRIYIASWELKPRDRVEVREAKTAQYGTGHVKVIYEDRDIIVVDKPAGILSAGDEKGLRQNMASLVRGYLRRKYQGASYLKPVHRLDAETSGVMVFSKSKKGDGLEEQFKQHKIERRYLAIVSGRIRDESGTIRTPLEKGAFEGGRKSRASPEGKKAVTEYRVKERYANATLLELRVLTGRTHQIRVHLSHMGYPIIGDKLYGGEMLLPRHALHAHRLGFAHPATGKWMTWESPPPHDLAEFIDRMRGY